MNKQYNNPPEEVEKFEGDKNRKATGSKEVDLEELAFDAYVPAVRTESPTEKAEQVENQKEKVLTEMQIDRMQVEMAQNTVDKQIEEAQGKKDTGAEPLEDKYTAKTNHTTFGEWKRKFKNGFVGTMALLGIGNAATAQGNEMKVPAEAFAKARLVKEKPAGYADGGEKGGKTFYYTAEKNTSTKSLPEATPGGEKGGDQYEAFLQEKLASGISPEELAKKKYISPSQIEKYKPFYKESLDVVYVEKNKEQKEIDPFAAYAQRGEVIYTPGASGYLVAEICYPDRDSKDIKDGGALNTQEGSALLRFRKKDAIGNDMFTGEVALLTPGEIDTLFGGTNHFRSAELLALLKARAQHN